MNYKKQVRNFLIPHYPSGRISCTVRSVLLAAIALIFGHATMYAQTNQSLGEDIRTVGRPSSDSVSLRWAPVNFEAWRTGNTSGYTIERYVLIRDGQMLRVPERRVLASGLKPRPEEQWENLVTKNQYAAIAAQALYGDRFEIDLSQSNVFTIVNKVKENEQRFHFALFCADISPVVARASGLYFTDKAVKKGEKYLYKIYTVAERDTVRGSIFISPDDVHSLPKPQNLVVNFRDNVANLRWDKPYRQGLYTAFQIERSNDGKTFRTISDIPMTTLSPTDLSSTRYEYAMDSVSDVSATYHYRVRGVSPFGEQGTPSDVVSGQATFSVSQKPFIFSGENIDNKSIRIEWEFPQNNNALIRGFLVERSRNPNTNFIRLFDAVLPPASRSYEDKQPSTVNYYRVVAYGKDGQEYVSPVHLAQLVDSIPPAAPSELKATVDNDGNVVISWKPNTEQDIFGYRVYKGNHEAEELAQITSEPVSRAQHNDKVNLSTLDENVFYQVMAIDYNQNHSVLSEKLRVPLPDKVKPQPPVMLPPSRKEKELTIRWVQSGSRDVVRYDVYRQRPPQKEWIRLKMVAATSDTAYQYTDGQGEVNISHNYTVVAVDEAELESDPATPISAVRIDNSLKPSITWKEPVVTIDDRKVLLQWTYDEQRVSAFRIYRKVDDGPMVLVKTMPAQTREFSDSLSPEKKYQYQVMVVFEGGRQSKLSEAMNVSL